MWDYTIYSFLPYLFLPTYELKQIGSSDFDCHILFSLFFVSIVALFSSVQKASGNNDEDT